MSSHESKPEAWRTTPDFDPDEVALWRQMSASDKMALVARLCREADERLIAEIRPQYPGASDREIFLRKAIARLGYDLAAEAFPDARRLAG